MAEESLLMKSEEARLGPCGGRIGRNKWLKMLQSGEIPSIQCGNKRLIPRAALLRWIEERTHRAS